MANRIVEALEQAAERVGRKLSTDASEAVKKLYEDAGSKTDDIVKRVTESDAESAHKLLDAAEQMGKKNAAGELKAGETAAESDALKQKFGDILDPKNAGKPVKYLDDHDKPIPTSELTHPDLADAEKQRLQAIQNKLRNDAEDYKKAHGGQWPPTPPGGVDASHQAVQDLLPKGYDPYHGMSRDDWTKSITKPNGDLAWAEGKDFPQGFSSPTDRHPVTLQPGQTIDRFGGPTGQFTSPPNTPYPQRALPPYNLEGKYHQYEVVKPLPVWEGGIAPQMGEPGGGVQHYLPFSVQTLIDGGYLKEKAL
jgi:hypothetical protein